MEPGEGNEGLRATTERSRDRAREARKRCPDCAEEVLAAARKCRYCGYRFDRRESAPRSLLGGLLPGLRRPARDATLEDVLADWGVQLGVGEVVRWFRLADVDQNVGYLLVTSERLIFFRQVARAVHERAFEYRLAALSQAKLSGGPWRRTLELRAGPHRHRVRPFGHGELARLSGHLDQALGGEAAGRSPRSTC